MGKGIKLGVKIGFPYVVVCSKVGTRILYGVRVHKGVICGEESGVKQALWCFDGCVDDLEMTSGVSLHHGMKLNYEYLH